jgi:hypothetical protein
MLRLPRASWESLGIRNVEALDHGADLLDQYGLTPDIQGKDAKSIRGDFVATAGTPGAFNKGDIGPGHTATTTSRRSWRPAHPW